MKHIPSAKVEKIDKDFIFKNRRKMTKSGSLVTHCEGKKIKNRLKPFIFTNWTILSDLEQKKNFRKIRRKMTKSGTLVTHCEGKKIKNR